MFKVASWNLNSVCSRLNHVTTWLQAREPDVLLLQELKGTEFPSEAFKSLGYESVAVTQKAYNGVAILSRHPMKTIAKALVGDDSDSHARFLEVIIEGIRIVNIYLPNGNPVGSPHQRIEVSLIVTGNIAGKPSGTLAVENHQLCQSLRIANRLFVIRDGSLGLGDRSVLIPHHVRPKPSINGFLVGLQHALSQAKAGMKKRLIILERGVEALNQSQQCCPVKICEFCFDICPRGL